jgi:RNA polymerase sigma-70 factor
MNADDLFEILVRQHSEMLRAYLSAVCFDPSARDDIFQETWLTAWRRLDDYDKSRPFGPWLRGIAARVMLAQRRQHRRVGILCDDDILDALREQHDRLDRQPGDTWDEQLEGLRHCLEHLPEPYLSAIRLKYVDELEPMTLLDRLQITAEALKKRLQRGRAKLLECLERRLRWSQSPELGLGNT